MALDRRTFLRSAGAGAVLGGPFAGFVSSTATAAPSFRSLVPVADARDGVVRLHLPSGFSYRSFHDTSVPVELTDGTMLPGRHDGMGAFPGPSGRSILVRNHEINGPAPAFASTAPVYDPMTGGGTTTVDVDGTGNVVSSRASLAGTQMNCSGGQMPWGSWITCEETVNGPDVGPDFTTAPNTALTQPHGFIFEVPTAGTATGQPIRSAGRFAHESVAFDPVGNALYLTEDDFAFPSGFYRYLPPTNAMAEGRLDDGGRLQMLRVVGIPNADLAAEQRLRATYDVDWVDIDDPAPAFPYTPGQTAPTTNNTAIQYVAAQGIAQGAARFSRLEGSAYDDGVVYFCSTQGGGAPEGGPNPSVDGWGTGFGQIWAYRIEEQVLQLIYQSPGRDTLDFPDNVTTSARGTLVVCEDHDKDNYLRGLTRGGRIFDLALNRMAGRSGDEFAGTTFSPDHRTLFVNIQASRGLTFAIWGPWTRIGV
ncbi:MAG TPA: alkaline phosphatase PhoX [Nocardioides sp.]|nr:alkaline phosphatase PhoX [Nocardioides sp.]